MVEVKLKDGTTEKVTVRELSKRMQSNEKLLEVMSNKAKAPETETGTIKYWKNCFHSLLTRVWKDWTRFKTRSLSSAALSSALKYCGGLVSIQL